MMELKRLLYVAKHSNTYMNAHRQYWTTLLGSKQIIASFFARFPSCETMIGLLKRQNTGILKWRKAKAEASNS